MLNWTHAIALAIGIAIGSMLNIDVGAPAQALNGCGDFAKPCYVKVVK